MKIAIQGHPTRGKEVIQILKSLGATSYNIYDKCSNPKWYWYINKNREITCDPKRSMWGYKLYTIEEFEKEFPYKIGETVITTLNHVGTIIGIVNSKYKVLFKEDSALVAPRRLKPYKEMKEGRNITLTLDKAQEWYKKGGELKEIALQAFSEKELNPLPRSWEEFCEKYPIQDHEAFINYANGNITICKECAGSGLGVWKRKPEKDRCKCVSQKSAEAHLAMIQLEQLRNCWRQGWKPTSEKAAYAIKVCSGKLDVFHYFTREFLSFPTREMAEEFLKCFRDLIEKAGDLI